MYGDTINKFSIDGFLTGNSDLNVPTEKAVKSYVDYIDAFDYDKDSINEIQSLSMSNDTLFLNNGGFVKLPHRHYIGELYGGGIVVAVWKDSIGVEHGLIASLSDLSTNAVWSNITALIGTSAQSPIDGQVNSNSIIAQAGHTLSAALLCDNYANGGFSDWYLPACWELDHCLKAAFVINSILGPSNGFQPDIYWSSTEISAGLAWTRLFLGLASGSTGKSTGHFVRAVRSF